MLKVKGILVSLLVALPVLGLNTVVATPAQAAIVNVSTVDRANPTAVTTAAIDNAIEIIKKYKDVSVNNQQLRNDIKTNVLPLFNTNYISLSLLNTYTRTATREQLVEFRNVIEDYMVNAFIEAMSFYNNQKVNIGTTQVVQNSATTNVTLVDTNQSYNIQFRMININNQYGIIDFTAEGISLVNTKSTEWQPILRQKGVAGLIEYVKNNMNNVLSDINQSK